MRVTCEFPISRGSRTRSLFAALFALSLLFGCASDEEAGSECAVTSDCASGVICQNGFCVTTPEQDSIEPDQLDVNQPDTVGDAVEDTLQPEDTVTPSDVSDVVDDVNEDINDPDTALDVEEEDTEPADVNEDVEGDTGENDVTEDVEEDVSLEDTGLEDVPSEDAEEDVPLEDAPEDVEEDIVEDIEEDLPPPGPVGLGEVCDGNCVDGYICKQQEDGLNRC